MKSIINEIRNQPHHVRELATVLCTVVVVAVVVLVWFNSFQKNMYALLNSDQQPQAEDRIFAKESTSLFGSIFQVFTEGKDQIFNLFSGRSNQADVVNPASQNNDTVGAPHPLPVSGNR